MYFSMSTIVPRVNQVVSNRGAREVMGRGGGGEEGRVLSECDKFEMRKLSS